MSLPLAANSVRDPLRFGANHAAPNVAAGKPARQLSPNPAQEHQNSLRTGVRKLVAGDAAHRPFDGRPDQHRRNGRGHPRHIKVSLQFTAGLSSTKHDLCDIGNAVVLAPRGWFEGGVSDNGSHKVLAILGEMPERQIAHFSHE